jgi:site-specific recombinase XerD
MQITPNHIDQFREYLAGSGTSPITVKEYPRNAAKLLTFAAGRELSPELLAEFREYIAATHKTVFSQNTVISAVNAFLKYGGKAEWRLKLFVYDRRSHSAGYETLTKAEFVKLVSCAKENEMTEAALLLELIANTGLRAQEIQQLTIGDVRQGYADITHDRKTRRVEFPPEIADRLIAFAEGRGITSGCGITSGRGITGDSGIINGSGITNSRGITSDTVFTDKTGKPFNRFAVGQRLRKLAERAGFPSEKVSSAALRNYYARNFLNANKDISALSDKLGFWGISCQFDYPVTSERERAENLDALYN